MPQRLLPESLLRLLLALLIPLVAAELQWILWGSIKPYIWFLFYPAVFFSSWIDGRRGGMLATVLSAWLAVYVFEPPHFTLATHNVRVWVSVSGFLVMGLLFSFFHEQLRKATVQAADALENSRDANDRLEQRVLERTLALEHATNTLKLSEERMAGIVNSAMDAIVSVDQEQRIVLFNPAAERMFLCKSGEVLGQPLDRLLPERFRDAHRAHLALFDRTGVSSRSMKSPGVLMALRSDGSEFPIEASISQVEVAGRKFFTVILREITERLLAEKALAESRALLKAIIDGSLEPIFFKDRHSRFLLANPATLRVMGRSSDQVMGRSDDEIYEDKRTGLDIIATDRRIMDSGVGETLEETIRTPEGERIYLSTKTPHRDSSGKVVGLIGVAVEITERKRSERELAEREARFRNTLDRMLEGCQIIGFDWRYLYVNETAARYGRTTREALVGRALQESYPGIVGSPMYEALRAGLQGRESSRREYEFAYGDGTKAVFEMVIQPVPEGIFIISLDITEQRKLEAQLRHAQKMDAIGTLAGGIAHDFNNILSAIIGFSELIRMRGTADAETLESVEDILMAGRRATSLVRQILTFSRHQKLERKPVQLAPVVTESLRLLRATIPANFEFRVELPAGLPPVLADESQVHQVLMNLGVNAWHAMRPLGRGQITVALREFEVGPDHHSSLPDLQPGTFLRLSLSDTGTGMTREILDRIFEPFFTTKAPGSGTGLGLSVVHGIMRAHDGAISVYSTPGEGTVFHLYFPALMEGQQLAPFEEKALPHGNRERILFLDDEEALVRMGRGMLERLGYEVTTSTNPASALEELQVKAGLYSLVISDLNMPGMTGLEFVQRVRESGLTLPVILSTGFIGDLRLDKLKPLGIVELLNKPILLSSLSQAIAQAIAPQADSSKLPLSQA